jgi:hypothetical protein
VLFPNIWNFPHLQGLKWQDKAIAEHSINLGHRMQLHITSILANNSRYMDWIIREATEIELQPNIICEDGFFLSRSWKPLIRDLKEHKLAPNKNTMPSGELWRGPFSFILLLLSLISPLPVTCFKATYWSASHSHIPFLWLASFRQPLLFRSYISPLLPCLVTSTPEDGDSMFLWNVGIDLQIHMMPKPKNSTTTW